MIEYNPNGAGNFGGELGIPLYMSAANNTAFKLLRAMPDMDKLR
jgi:hypothetical protein